MQLANIRFNNPVDGQQIASLCGSNYNPTSDVVISRIDADGEMMGGVLYQGYTGPGGSICVHMAATVDGVNWGTPDLLWVIFDYAFNQLGVKKIFGQVPVWNEKALKIDLKLGFREEHIVKDVYPDGDMRLMSMYREHCRFLNWQPRGIRANGRQSQSTSRT